MRYTRTTKDEDLTHQWQLIDVKNQILGRSATKIAQLLMGKSKSYYVPHLDCGDNVVVINAAYIKVTGKKLVQKIYTTYSGYPGGLRKESLGKKLASFPEDVIKRAVTGMLPKNKLRDALLKRLYVYKEEAHPYTSKFK